MSTKLKITNDTRWVVYWTSVLLPFTNTRKRDTPTPQPVRAIDGIGHVAEFDERLLIGSTLGFHIAAVHQYPQALHKKLMPVQSVCR